MSNQLSEKQGLETQQSGIAFGTLVATYNFSASPFCTAHPKLYCTSRAPAFAVDICSHMGQINSTAWKDTFGTLPLLFQQWFDWQEKGGSQVKAWNFLSTTRKATSSQTQHKPGSSWASWSLPTTLQLLCFALQNLSFLDNGRWQLSQSGSWRFAAFVVDLVSHMGYRAWKNNFGTLPLQEQLQPWRPRDWQEYGGSQDKKNYPCIMAGV